MRTFHGEEVLSQDLEFLRDGEIIQVVLDPFQVRFVFDNGTEVRSAFRFEIKKADSDEALYFQFGIQPRLAFDFYQLLRRKVIEIDAEAEDHLVLTLENDDTLMFLVEGRVGETLEISRFSGEKGRWSIDWQRFF